MVETFKQTKGSWRSGNYVGFIALSAGHIGKMEIPNLVNAPSSTYLHNLFYVSHCLVIDLYLYFGNCCAF